MSEYKIKITERLSATILVNTDNADTALERVQAMYKNSEIILTAENYVDTEFSVAGNESAENMEYVHDYICACGHTKFTARQVSYNNVIIGGKTIFSVDSYASGQPSGPYICVKCGKAYDELPLRGTEK
jgi:hypothetical protein